jgi:hypothetical protein
MLVGRTRPGAQRTLDLARLLADEPVQRIPTTSDRRMRHPLEAPRFVDQIGQSKESP